jgi:hypothetical protein
MPERATVISWSKKSAELAQLRTLIGLECPILLNLNFSNRPVRTRMPGGVAGVGQINWLPLCRLLALMVTLVVEEV